jgi:hypothetical protein
LNYRRCPNCRCWVEKLAGCDYIDCKCGSKFCFKCGNFFDKDPCRKAGLWKTSFEIKKLMAEITLQKPIGPECTKHVNILESLFFMPKLFIKILLSLVITPLVSIFGLAVCLILYALSAVFGPLMFCFIAS